MLAPILYEPAYIAFCEGSHFLLALALSSVAAVPILTIWSRVTREPIHTIPTFLLLWCSLVISWFSHIIADALNWGF